MVAPRATLSFGTQGSNTLVAEFEELSGSGAMADMLMKGMASQASKEVRDQFDSLNQ